MYWQWETQLPGVNALVEGGRPWREALADRAEALGVDIHTDLLLDEARGSWLWLVDPRDKEAALDLLGGVGSLSAALAHHYRTVHYLENRAEFLRFAGLRFRQDGLDRVQLISGTPLTLPFPEGALDCVTVHDLPGILGREWAAAGPRELRRLLSEVRRVLRPGGCLYIGVNLSPLRPENTPSGWYDQITEAIDLLRGHLLGRSLERELRRAGFPTINRYYAEPSYWQPQSMIPADRGAVRFYETHRQSRFRMIRRAAATLGLHGFSYPSRILLASG
jgi:SAM-dependent methyltransferase